MTVADRRGYTLAEALVALLVTGILTGCLAVVLRVVALAATRHAEASAAAETERTVAAILGREIRAATASDASFGADSVRLRAFRGSGVVCSHARGSITLAYEGIRLPEDDKDSVLVITEAGESAHDVTGVASSDDCAPRSTILTLDGADSLRAPLLALVFETGVYSIANRAFRYRLGSAGRQPLTEENLSTAASGIVLYDHAGHAAAARLTLKSAEARDAAPVDWLLGMPQGGAATVTRP